MDCRIMETAAFNAAGKSIRVEMDDGDTTRIPQFWGQCKDDGTLDRLIDMASNGAVLPGRILGICSDFSAETRTFTYTVAAEHQSGSAVDGLVVTPIPNSVWAVFESIGALPDAIQSVWREIMGGFFESSQYRPAETPDLEVYPPGDTSKPDYRCEVWISVVKK